MVLFMHACDEVMDVSLCFALVCRSVTVTLPWNTSVEVGFCTASTFHGAELLLSSPRSECSLHFVSVSTSRPANIVTIATSNFWIQGVAHSYGGALGTIRSHDKGWATLRRRCTRCLDTSEQGVVDTHENTMCFRHSGKLNEWETGLGRFEQLIDEYDCTPKKKMRPWW